LTWRKAGISQFREIHSGLSVKPGSSMIVCSCNVLSDKAVRSACASSAPRTTGQVYGCLGCSAQCGRCARTIRKIMNEALGAAGACPSGCACAAHAPQRD
jgi:bacterioferritin-associated ferredoxin